MTVDRLIRKYGKSKARGFTLVEILIVVIILGILAAIVIPQFTNASNDARKGNIVTQLQTLRAQIQLYKLQHKEQIPLLITGDGGTQWGVLTKYTDIDGNTSATADSTHVYGPYYQKGPMNPLSANANADKLAATATGTNGWVYDETTGYICATGTDQTKYLEESDGTDKPSPTW